MLSQPEATTPAHEETRARPVDRLYQDGLVAGLIGAAMVALWFLVMDTVRGRPLHTPSLLGAALFRRSEFLAAGGSVPISIEMVVVYTWVHGLVFCVMGGIASRLLALAEERPNIGFGVLLFFVVLMFGFVGVAMVFAEPVLRALGWPAIFIGNLLAAAAMAAYLWRRHPNLTILP